MTTGKPNLTNPYVGPRPFEEVESKFFFGRDEETKILSGLVVAHQLSLFYAQSGAGKSSLLRAGLLPRLTRKTRVGSHENAHLYQTMQVLPIVTVGRGIPPSTTAPIANIYSFSAQLILLPSADPNDLAVMTLRDALEILLDDGIQAGAVWEPAQERDGRVRPPLIKPDTTLLIFDQFEELFKVHPERWREREAFFYQINEVLAQFPALHILFTMREDHLAELTPYANLLLDDLRHRFRMERLRKEGALLAVTQPAQAGDPPRTFAPGVAEELVNNLRRIQHAQRSQPRGQDQPLAKDHTALAELNHGEYIEPVHLQIVCRDLWAGLPPEQTEIQESDLHSFGDVDQALTNFYVTTLAKVVAETDVSERALRHWFNEELITPARTKGLVYRDEEQGKTAGLTNAAVDILRDVWIIRGDIRGGDTWYELAHDRLVEPILAANLAWQTTYANPVAAAYARWEQGKSPENLLRDRDLLAAEAYARQQAKEVTEQEAQYLVDSRRQWDAAQAEKHRITQQRRIWLVTGVVVMVILAGLTLYAFGQLVRAQKAEADAIKQSEIAFTRQLLAQADQVYVENPLLGLRLALEAGEHFTQDESTLRAQIISQTLGYMTQGKIAALGTNAATFIDLPNKPWLIVKNNTENKDQWLSKVDGSLMAQLAGSVSKVEPITDTFPFYVVDYAGATHDELRRKTDGSFVTKLSGPMNQVDPVNAAFGVFVVYYADATPAELRRKTDGLPVPGLKGSVNRVDPITDSFDFFVVDYTDDAELRNKADGSFVISLSGPVSWYGISPVGVTSPFFTVYYAEAKTPAELRNQADGSLVQGLTGTLKNIIAPFDPTFPFFVVNYTGTITITSELRRQADSSFVTELADSVINVNPISDAFPFFVVDYTDDATPDELRRKTDGSLVPGLAGNVSHIDPMTNPSPFFIVSYYGGIPSELRSKADGSPVAKGSDSWAWSDRSYFFVVNDGGKGEWRSKVDGALITTLPDLVKSVHPVSEGFPFFVVHYAGETPGELRRKVDGLPVIGVTGSVSEVIKPFDDWLPFFVVSYADNTPSELRSKSDSSFVKKLPGPVFSIRPINNTFPFFVLDYADATRDELRNTADGLPVPGLAGSVNRVDPSTAAFPFFVVDYAGDTPDELRSKADGLPVLGVTGPVGGVDPGSDGFPFFVVYYTDKTSHELRRKIDGLPVPGVTGSVNRINWVNDAFPFFVVDDYNDDTPNELRRKADGLPVLETAGIVIGQIDPITDTFPFFVEYQGGQLRSKANGSLVPKQAGAVSKVYLLSAASPYFVVDYAGNTHGELRSTVNDSHVKELPGAVSFVDPVSAASPFFVVGYEGAIPGELRSKADGSLMPEQPGSVSSVAPASAAFPFFVVRYYGRKPSDTPGESLIELRSAAEGSSLMASIKNLDYDPSYSQGYFFVERSHDRHTELWQIDPLRRLVDLGIGLPWTDTQMDRKLPEDALLFNQETQTLSIRYEDGRAYLLDLVWLEEMQGRASADGRSNTEMIALACLPFANHAFDESLLQNVEYLGERPARACPEPIRLVEQGRHAARQLDVAAAIDLFRTAVAQDPTLILDPASEAAHVAAQSLARQGHLLLLQGELDAAATKFTQARDHDPAIEIGPTLQRLAASQLSTGQALLHLGEIVSATLRLDALAAMHEIFGAETLDQATRVAAAQAYVSVGGALAKEDKVAEATSAFAKALVLYPALEIDPGTQAKAIAAQTLLGRGRALGRDLRVEEASETLRAALALDPSIAIDAEEEAKRLAAATLLSQGQIQAKWGNAPGALAKFAEAQALDQSLDIDPVAEVTRLAPTPSATPGLASPLATPVPGVASPLATPTHTFVSE